MQCSESTTIKLTYIFRFALFLHFPSPNAWANERRSKALIEPITLNPPPPVLNCEEPGERKRTTSAELCSSFRVIKYANYYFSSSLVPPPSSSTGEGDGWINTISLDGGDKADWLAEWLADWLADWLHRRWLSTVEQKEKEKVVGKSRREKCIMQRVNTTTTTSVKNIFLPLIYVALIPSHEFCLVSLLLMLY